MAEEEKTGVENTTVKEKTGATEATEKKSLIDLINSDKELQSQFDKAKAESMKTAVDNAKIKWEEDKKNEEAESKKLAKMNEDEKTNYEKEKLEKELAELKAKNNARDLRDEALNMLTEKNIPPQYANIFNFENMTAENVKAGVELIESLRSKDREEWLNQVLKQKTPTQKEITEVGKTEDPFLKGFNSI